MLALGLEVLLQQDREFNGQKIVNCRKKAAVALLAGHPVGLSDVDDVLDFFDQVGFLLRRGAIDPEMAWHSFFCWVNRYWLASEDYIHRKQTEDKNVWADFSLLRSRLLEVELAKDPQSREAQLTSQSPQINEFFKDEAKTIPMKDWV